MGTETCKGGENTPPSAIGEGGNIEMGTANSTMTGTEHSGAEELEMTDSTVSPELILYPSPQTTI